VATGLRPVLAGQSPATTRTSEDYLVSTLGLWPEHFLLTTGTFNLVVKDRIAFRLSGAYSVQAETA